jgi:hypothetical protein
MKGPVRFKKVAGVILGVILLHVIFGAAAVFLGASSAQAETTCAPPTTETPPVD